jgi:hypothetical protein
MVNVFEDWPAKTLDLNLIESLWATLKARVEEERPANREELITMIIVAWDKLPMTIVNSVVDAMPRRSQKLCDKRGECIGHYTSEFRSTATSRNDRSTWSTFWHNFSHIRS